VSWGNEIETNFSFLAEYGFIIFIPQDDEMGDIRAVFTCPSFQIYLIQYRQELSLDLLKTNNNEYKSEEEWVAFPWLIEYLSGNEYKTNFFEDESDYETKIKKQINSLSGELRTYINIIIEFYKSTDYKEQYAKLRDYIFKRLNDMGLLPVKDSQCDTSTTKKPLLNKTLKGISTFSLFVGILLVCAALSGVFINHKNLAVVLVTLGAFLCLFVNFISYREAIKKNDSISTQNVFFRLVAILIGLGLALLRLFFGQ
jgi:hypothetical protein